MAFGHPAQHQHMVSGLQKAIASPNTPAHLKPHLHKRLQEHTMKQPVPTMRSSNLYKSSRNGKTTNPIFNMDQIASGISPGSDVSQPAASRQKTQAVNSAPKKELGGQGAPRKVTISNARQAPRK